MDTNDEMLKQMMLDLGGDRREYISTAESRDRHNKQSSRFALADGPTALSMQHTAAVPLTSRLEPTDPESSALQAWNNPGSFSQDVVTESLPNYFGGQGHRERARTLRQPYDRRREHMQNLYSEERVLYLEEQARARDASHASSLSGVNTARVVDEECKKSPGTSRALRKPRPSSLPFTSDARHVIDKSSVVPGLAHPGIPLTEHEKDVHGSHWAVHPGDSRQAFYTTHPEGLDKLREKRQMFMNIAFSFTNDPTSTRTINYYIDYPEQKWMLEEAVRAKDAVETGTDVTTATYQSDPRFKAFFEQASGMFSRKPQLVITLPAVEVKSAPTESKLTINNKATFPKITSHVPYLGNSSDSSDSEDSSPSTSPEAVSRFMLPESESYLNLVADFKKLKVSGETSIYHTEPEKPATATTVPDTMVNLQGHVTATFNDHLQQALEVRAFPVTMPVNITITITPTTSDVASQNLMSVVQDLAAAVNRPKIDKTQAEKAHDGVWQACGTHESEVLVSSSSGLSQTRDDLLWCQKHV